MLIQTVVGGSLNKADGTEPNLRSGRQGDLIVSELHGKYYEQCSRENLFSAVLAATTGTVAAGNINGAAAGASTQFALWNPIGSGVNLAIVKVIVAPISGTPPGGPPFHSFALGTPNASIGTRATCNNITGGTSKALYLASAAGAALTGSPNALSLLRPMAMNFFSGALASGTNVNGCLEVIDSDIVIPPGTMWVPTYSAAGTNFLNTYGVTWEEVPS